MAFSSGLSVPIISVQRRRRGWKDKVRSSTQNKIKQSWVIREGGNFPSCIAGQAKQISMRSAGNLNQNMTGRIGFVDSMNLLPPPLSVFFFYTTPQSVYSAHLEIGKIKTLGNQLLAESRPSKTKQGYNFFGWVICLLIFVLMKSLDNYSPLLSKQTFWQIRAELYLGKYCQHSLLKQWNFQVAWLPWMNILSY